MPRTGVVGQKYQKIPPKKKTFWLEEKCSRKPVVPGWVGIFLTRGQIEEMVLWSSKNSRSSLNELQSDYFVIGSSLGKDL